MDIESLLVDRRFIAKLRYRIMCLSMGQERHVASQVCNVFTGTAKLRFSTPCISIATELISTKFIYLCPSYTQLCIPN